MTYNDIDDNKYYLKKKIQITLKSLNMLFADFKN